MLEKSIQVEKLTQPENGTEDCGKSSSRPGFKYAVQVQKDTPVNGDPTHPENRLFGKQYKNRIYRTSKQGGSTHSLVLQYCITQPFTPTMTNHLTLTLTNPPDSNPKQPPDPSHPNKPQTIPTNPYPKPNLLVRTSQRPHVSFLHVAANSRFCYLNIFECFFLLLFSAG